MGRCQYQNGNVYDGTWHNDLPEGEGSLSVVTGHLHYKGVFYKGRPTQIPTKMNLTFPKEALGATGRATAKKGGKGSSTDDGCAGSLVPVRLTYPGLEYPFWPSSDSNP